MSKPRPNPYQTTSDLIANTIGTARVFGENRRITNLVSSSIGKLVLEMNDCDAGEALLSHALSCISTQDAEYVPALHEALKALLTARA
jgi:hypothetical protein